MTRRIQWAVSALTLLEVGLLGLFFVQALRFTIGALYGSVAGVSAAFAVDPALIPPELLPDSALLNDELALAAYVALLPSLFLIFGRIRLLSLVAALVAAGARALMLIDVGISPTQAALVVIGASLIYILSLVRFRLWALPYFFVLGLGVDQVLRAFGDTLDPSWSAGYQPVQIALSAVVALSALAAALIGRSRDDAGELGTLPLWGAFALGGLLYLELALLALPNAIANRAGSDYTLLVPLVLAATMLPILPAVRSSARRFIALFDPNLRGWVWMLLIALLVILGTRLQGIGAGIALVAAQFLVSLLWWWVGRPKAAREVSFSGLWIVFGVAIFLLLLLTDNFTYEYAFVRDLTGDLAFLNETIPPLLRGLRGFGLGVLLLAVFLAVLPITQTQRRIPWTGGSMASNAAGLVFAAAAVIAAALAAQPPVVLAVRTTETIRVGTFNIHGGFDEFYNQDLPAIARVIRQSGANVVLLQEVEAGRMTSFGVDQPLWLARRLGMDVRFFPTNEGLQGLAALSNIPIAFDDGSLLTSLGNQTGVQRIQIQPEPGIVVTLYNTWLSPLVEISSAEATIAQIQDQQRQLNEIITLIAAHHPGGVLGRTVVAGTFHNVPDSPLIEQMRSLGFLDAFAGQNPEISATFVRTGLPQARFDYIWLRNLTRLGAGVMNDPASDHRMAVTEIVISPR
jgi:endonuclease/exonuclease/phosphatase family metal-dependent hydrolase